MMQNNVAIAKPNEKIISFGVVNGNKKEKQLTKSGETKKTHSNKEADISSEVYPLKTKEEINSVIDVLDFKIDIAPTPEKVQIACRNKMMWLIGMNIGIRASDLRTLKWSFFFDIENGERVYKEFYSLKPQKTRKKGKFVKLYFNQTVKQAINEYLEKYPISDDGLDNYIFMGREGKPISVQQMWNVVCNTAAEAGIKQNVGTHTLRKTWAFHCWHDAQDKNKALIVLQRCFNHNSPLTTLGYIGILDTEIKEMYTSVELGFRDEPEERFPIEI